MRKLFGTDGIRGTANAWPMTAETALQVAVAAGRHFMRSNERHRVVIGKDTRLSGYMIETAIASGICAMGGTVLLTGPIPTPAVAQLTPSITDHSLSLNPLHRARHSTPNAVQAVSGRSSRGKCPI